MEGNILPQSDIELGKKITNNVGNLGFGGWVAHSIYRLTSRLQLKT